MTKRALTLLGVLSGCGDPGGAPGRTDGPEVVFYLVKNEVFSIHLDGTMRHSWGVVGDDRLRAGYPRLLPDGRLSVVADHVGTMYPFTSGLDRGYDRIELQGLSLGDGACGAVIGGQPALIYFSTLVRDGSHTTTDAGEPEPLISSIAWRASTDGRDVEAFGQIQNAGLFGPSPDGDDHLLAVHAPIDGDDQLWRIDVSGDQEEFAHPEVLATIPFPSVAVSPSRLPDGRIAYVQFDMRDPDRVGELWLADPGGALHATGLRGIDDAVVVGDKVVLQAGGGDKMGDLLVTDLVHDPYNLTNTPFVAEHLGWAAPELVGVQ